MKVLVCGSRGWRDRGAIRAAFTLLPEDTTIIHGGARGADALAGEVAKEFGFDVIVHYAEWTKHGKAAGIKRNLAMLDTNPDKVIAFWDGESRGTQHTIQEAIKREIQVILVPGATAA